MHIDSLGNSEKYCNSALFQTHCLQTEDHWLVIDKRRLEEAIFLLHRSLLENSQHLHIVSIFVILIGDILDKHFEHDIKSSSDLEYEKTIPLIHRYSLWRFFSFEQLETDLQHCVKKVEILTQPESFPLSRYRKDLRLWV